MRIELTSTLFEDISSMSEKTILDTTRASSLSNRIHSFASEEMREYRFDADYQAPLGTTGKAATMGKRLLLSQKV